jgi:hypothetical protein
MMATIPFQSAEAQGPGLNQWGLQFLRRHNDWDE